MYVNGTLTNDNGLIVLDATTPSFTISSTDSLFAGTYLITLNVYLSQYSYEYEISFTLTVADQLLYSISGPPYFIDEINTAVVLKVPNNVSITLPDITDDDGDDCEISFNFYNLRSCIHYRNSVLFI